MAPDRLLPNAVLSVRLRLVAWVRWGLIADCGIAGSGYAVGPPSWSATPALDTIRALPVPVAAWGWAWVAAAAAMTAGHWVKPAAVAGHVAASIAFTFWGICLIVPVVLGASTGFGGFVHHLLLGGLHLWLAAVAVFDREFPAGTVGPHDRR